MLKQVTLGLALFVAVLFCTSLDKSYGPFKMRLSSFVVCSGPKTVDCTIMKANITGETTIYLTLKVIKDCKPSKAKIVASTNGKELARLHMNKPCDHLFLKPLLTSMYNVTKNCIIKKGDYALKVDIGEIADNYFGGRFFYGSIGFKAVFYNEEYNFSCADLVVIGDYSKRVDIAEIASNYFGGSFFYGNVTFKATIYSDDCNFSCCNLTASMSPKK